MNGTLQYTIRPYDTIWMLAQVFNTTVDSIMELNPGIEPRNLMIGQVITIRPGYQYYPSYSEEMDENIDMGQDMEDLTGYFRMLWEQHVMWTRIAVMAILYDLPGTDLIIQRLLRNPADFANALEPFYGAEAAKEFERLFTEHLTIAAEIVKAAKAGNNESVAAADQRWRENADQIAALLSTMNPYWSEDDWSAMLNEHLDLLAANVAASVAGNLEESINGFDKIEMQALEMADMMSEGIAMQFPD